MQSERLVQDITSSPLKATCGYFDFIPFILASLDTWLGINGVDDGTVNKMLINSRAQVWNLQTDTVTYSKKRLLKFRC